MFPDWVLKHKVKGTQINKIKDKYYLYSSSSIRVKGYPYPKKVTSLIGKITPDGLIPKYSRKPKQISVKEFGSSFFLSSILQPISDKLSIHFPDSWQKILVLAILRVIHNCPFKDMDDLYQYSFLSESFPDLNLNKNNLTELIRNVGSNRENIVAFLKEFVLGSEHVIFDMTNVHSESHKMLLNERGYNSNIDFEKQVNLMYIFAVDKQMPIYYRIAPGNIREIKAFKLSLEEAGLKNAVSIMDKGFNSEK